MTDRRFCDGVTRRSLLRIGTAGVFGYGLDLPRLLWADEPRGDASGRTRDTGVSLIYIFLKGGLSTIDTWDPKPNAPSEFRGDFSPISSIVPGMDLCEHLPQVARQADKFSLIRGFGHRNSDHGPADHYMLTGYHPVAGFNPSISPNNQRPSIGSIISRKRRSAGDVRSGNRGADEAQARHRDRQSVIGDSVPAYVCLPVMHNSAGPSYLGAGCAPLVIEADPAAPDFKVPDLMPPLTLRANRLASRRELLSQVDVLQKSAETRANEAAGAMSVFRQRAFDLMTSPAAKQAFNIHAESDKLRDEYGRTTLGQSCLMARRLVEAGVRCVTVEHSNWDTHDNNFKTLRQDLLPQLDSAMSTLFRDLHDRGMLDRALVLITGEFGRTPRINKNAGRDHWGPAFTVAVGGGGIRGGRVIGASDERAERPTETPHGPEDLVATIFHQMGIDPNEEFLTPEGRPVKVVNGGNVIRNLL